MSDRITPAELDALERLRRDVPRLMARVRALEAALRELTHADDAMLHFLIAVDPAVIGEGEWCRQRAELTGRKQAAYGAARAALEQTP